MKILIKRHYYTVRVLYAWAMKFNRKYIGYLPDRTAGWSLRAGIWEDGRHSFTFHSQWRPELLMLSCYYKKAVLSQRWPRNAPYTRCPKNFRDFLTMPTGTIPNIFHGLLFRSTLWMFLHMKSVALPVPEIIGVTQKIWAVPGYAHAPFSKIFNGLLFGLAL